MKQSIRVSDVFIKEDLRSVLQALLDTNETITKQMISSDIQDYYYGFSAAITAVAAAFDIKLERLNLWQ